MPLRVLFVNPGRDLGGAERCLLLLLRELLALEVEPTVALFGEGRFATALAALAVPTVYLKLSDSVRQASRYQTGAGRAGLVRLGMQAIPSAAQLVALTSRLRADIVHTNGLKAHLLAGLAGRLARRPVVWHMRDLPPGGAQGRLVRTAARLLPSTVIAVSGPVAASLAPGGASRPRVITLHDPIDITRFPPGVDGRGKRAELSLADTDLVVGIVAHLTPWKGHEVFLRMAKVVAEAVPEARFLIVGGPIYETAGHSEYAEHLEQLAGQLGLNGKVQFLGNREDVPQIMSALDVLVHCPTAAEPFGLAPVEAMAAGRPVVASAAGGILETVQRDVTGLLVPPGDTAGFASAVVRLLKDPELRARMGAAGRRHVEQMPDPAAHARRVLQTYRQLLE